MTLCTVHNIPGFSYVTYIKLILSLATPSKEFLGKFCTKRKPSGRLTIPIKKDKNSVKRKEH